MENQQNIIVDPIHITINNSYNIVDWEKRLIERCMNDNPSSTVAEIAAMLGFSDRTLRRKFHDYNIRKP